MSDKLKIVSSRRRLNDVISATGGGFEEEGDIQLV
jgi:hypothetical protein